VSWRRMGANRQKSPMLERLMIFAEEHYQGGDEDVDEVACNAMDR